LVEKNSLDVTVTKEIAESESAIIH